MQTSIFLSARADHTTIIQPLFARANNWNVPHSVPQYMFGITWLTILSGKLSEVTLAGCARTILPIDVPHVKRWSVLVKTPLFVLKRSKLLLLFLFFYVFWIRLFNTLSHFLVVSSRWNLLPRHLMRSRYIAFEVNKRNEKKFYVCERT